MMNIILKEVDMENWEECIDLKVSEDQKSFVAPNWYSILESKFGEDIYTLCIYDKEIMVGFLMYDIDPDTNRWELSRLMIDKKYQKMGYGRSTMIKLMEELRGKLGEIEFFTSVEPENIVAKNFYKGLGFKETGEIMWDEEVLVIEL